MSKAPPSPSYHQWAREAIRTACICEAAAVRPKRSSSTSVSSLRGHWCQLSVDIWAWDPQILWSNHVHCLVHLCHLPDWRISSCYIHTSAPFQRFLRVNPKSPRSSAFCSAVYYEDGELRWPTIPASRETSSSTPLLHDCDRERYRGWWPLRCRPGEALPSTVQNTSWWLWEFCNRNGNC